MVVALQVLIQLIWGVVLVVIVQLHYVERVALVVLILHVELRAWHVGAEVKETVVCQ